MILYMKLELLVNKIFMEYQQFNTPPNSSEQIPPQPIQTTPPTPPPPQFTQIPQQQSRVKQFISVIIIAIILIGGSAFAYYKFTKPSISPKEIFQKALESSMDIRSFSFNATSTGQVTNNIVKDLPSSSSFTMSYNGSIDFHSQDTFMLDIDFMLNANTNSATSSGSLVLGIETIYLQKSIFFNIKDFNVTYNSSDQKLSNIQAFVGMANGFVNSLKNKWIQINISTSTQKTAVSQNLLNDEDKTMIRNYILGMRYITSLDNVGEENINSVNTYHLKVSIQNGQELTDLVRKIMSSKNVDDLDKKMDNLSKSINQRFDLDIWVGKDDYLVYKIVTIPITISDSKTGTKSTTSQEITISNHNKPIAVSAPQNTISIEEIMQYLFGGVSDGKTVKATVQKTGSVGK